MSRQRRRARAKKDIPPVVREIMRSNGVAVRQYLRHEVEGGRITVVTSAGIIWPGDQDGSRLRLVE